MALAEATNAARKSILDEAKSSWVRFRPIKLSEGDLVLVNRPKSDWLQELYRVDKAVHKNDLEGAKIGAYFSVVDRVDPEEKDWRRIILKKIRKDEWQVISDTGESILDNINENGVEGLLAGWSSKYRAAMMIHFDQAMDDARKRRDDHQATEDALNVSPKRKKIREENVMHVKRQARAMKQKATTVEGKSFEVGDVVQYNLADVDCTKVDSKVLTYVIVEKKGAGNLFRLANSAGVLRDLIYQCYLTHQPNATLKLLNLEKAFQCWRGMPVLPTRQIASIQSIYGGQGKSKEKCGCRKGKCNTKQCKCHTSNRRCNSSCHGGQANKNCLNCTDIPMAFEMCPVIDEGE